MHVHRWCLSFWTFLSAGIFTRMHLLLCHSFICHLMTATALSICNVSIGSVYIVIIASPPFLASSSSINRNSSNQMHIVAFTFSWSPLWLRIRGSGYFDLGILACKQVWMPAQQIELWHLTNVKNHLNIRVSFKWTPNWCTSRKSVNGQGKVDLLFCKAIVKCSRNIDVLMVNHHLTWN